MWHANQGRDKRIAQGGGRHGRSRRGVHKAQQPGQHAMPAEMALGPLRPAARQIAAWSHMAAAQLRHLQPQCMVGRCRVAPQGTCAFRGRAPYWRGGQHIPPGPHPAACRPTLLAASLVGATTLLTRFELADSSPRRPQDFPACRPRGRIWTVRFVCNESTTYALLWYTQSTLGPGSFAWLLCCGTSSIPHSIWSVQPSQHWVSVTLTA